MRAGEARRLFLVFDGKTPTAMNSDGQQLARGLLRTRTKFSSLGGLASHVRYHINTSSGKSRVQVPRVQGESHCCSAKSKYWRLSIHSQPILIRRRAVLVER